MQTIEEADEDLELTIGLIKPYCNILDGTPNEIDAVNSEVRPETPSSRFSVQIPTIISMIMMLEASSEQLVTCSLLISCLQKLKVVYNGHHENILTNTYVHVRTLIDPALSLPPAAEDDPQQESHGQVHQHACPHQNPNRSCAYSP